MKLKGLSRILQSPGAPRGLLALKISDFIKKVKLFPMSGKAFFMLILLLLIAVRTRIFRTTNMIHVFNCHISVGYVKKKMQPVLQAFRKSSFEISFFRDWVICLR